MSKPLEKAYSEDMELGSANLLELILKNLKLVIAVVALAAIVSAVVSFIIPEKFKSTVTMFPSSGSEPLGMLLTDENIRGSIIRYGDKEDGERLMQLINSHDVQSRVIDACNLWEHYKIDPEYPGARSLISLEYNGNVDVEMTRFGSVVVEVLDEDPEMAAKIANSISEFTDTVDVKIRRSRALSSFNIAKKEHEDLLKEIRFYEDSIAVLRTLGVYDYFGQIPELTEQYAAAIGMGYTERANRIKEEMELLSEYGHTYNHLAKKIERLYDFENTIALRMEQFSIDISGKMPVKFVVDDAKVADKKSYPIRWLIVVMSTAGAFFFVVVALLIFNNLRAARQD